MSSPATNDSPGNTLREVMERYWGYDRFRPLQEPAMRRVMAGADSVVVLPTGGGKSLCYQILDLRLTFLIFVSLYKQTLHTLWKRKIKIIHDQYIVLHLVLEDIVLRRKSQVMQNGICFYLPMEYMFLLALHSN